MFSESEEEKSESAGQLKPANMKRPGSSYGNRLRLHKQLRGE